MEQKETSHCRGLRIGLLDSDPCALENESGLVQHMQNLNGCHITLWATTNVEHAVHNCLFGAVPTEVFIVDLETESRRRGKIIHPVKAAAPGTAIIGITSHIEEHQVSQYGTAVDTILDKATLKTTLPDVIATLYDKKLLAKHCTAGADSAACDSSGPERTRKRTKKEAANRESKVRSIWDVRPPPEENDTQSEILRLNHETQYDSLQHFAQFPQSDKSETLSRTAEFDQTDFSSLPSVPLTPTEQQVLSLSLTMTPREVADHLTVSESTVYSHRYAIKRKFHRRTWDEAVELYLEMHTGTQ